MARPSIYYVTSIVNLPIGMSVRRRTRRRRGRRSVAVEVDQKVVFLLPGAYR